MLLKVFEKLIRFLKQNQKYKDYKWQFQELYTIHTVARMTYVPTKWRGFWANIVQIQIFQS